MIDRKLLAALRAKEDARFLEKHPVSGKMFADLQLPALDVANDRVMICGSPHMLKDLKHMLEGRGFKEGTTSTPGDFVIERAVAEK